MTRAVLALLVAASAAPAVMVAARPAAAAAAADDAAHEKAKRHFKKGEKLFALGRFADALVEYERAFDADPLPEFLFNIGQCHRNLEHYDEAIFSFNKFLRLRPDAPNRAAVEKLLDELEDKKARQPRDDQRVPLVPVEPERPRTRESPAFYTRWWFWTGVVVVAAGAGAAVVLWPEEGGLPSSDLGNLDFP